MLGHRLSGSSAGPTHFEVSLPDGQTHFYGRDTFGSFDVVSVVKDGVKLNVSWPLLATRDGAGNRINYHYTKHHENGLEVERYLSQISYGNNPIFNDRQVILEYEDRPDRSFAFQYGRRIQSTKRLSRVAMQVNAGGWKQVREYRLAYEPISKSVTHRSRLSSITECGAAIEGLPVACLNPTTFEWSPSAWDNHYFGVGAVQGFTNPIGTSTLITTDLDGDGRTDLAFPSSIAWHYVFARPTPVNGNRYYEHFVTAKAPGVSLPGPLKGVASTAYVFDVDFDDQPDLLFRDANGVEPWKGYLTRGSDGTVARLITGFHGALNESANVNATIVFADFDGDGLQDMLERSGGPPGTSLHNWAWRRRADSVALVPQNGMLLESKGWGPVTVVPELGSLGVNQVVALDAFGEGRSRVIHKAPNSSLLSARSLVDGNVRTLILPAELLTLDIRTADLNGDGLTDLITNGSGLTPTPDGQLRYYLNTGNGYSAPIMMQQAVAGWKAARVIDVNSDGLADLIVPRLDLNNPTLARGIDLIQTHFDAQGLLSFFRKPLFDIPQTSIVELARNGLRIVDVEGDGDPDLLHVRSDGVKSLYKHGSPGKPDELQVIRDGRHMPGGPAGVQPIGTGEHHLCAGDRCHGLRAWRLFIHRVHELSSPGTQAPRQEGRLRLRHPCRRLTGCRCPQRLGLRLSHGPL